MRKAYLGIAEPAGLHVLVPETAHAAGFLVRRAERLRAVCFWAVIDDAFYVALCLELERGERLNALRLLQLLSQMRKPKAEADQIRQSGRSTYSIEQRMRRVRHRHRLRITHDSQRTSNRPDLRLRHDRLW